MQTGRLVVCSSPHGAQIVASEIRERWLLYRATCIVKHWPATRGVFGDLSVDNRETTK